MSDPKPISEPKDVLDLTADVEAGYVNPHYTPIEISRRRFLGRISAVLTGVGAVVVAVPVGAFIVAPLFSSGPGEDKLWKDVGPIDQFKVGDTQAVAFDDPSPLPWAGVTARTAAWLRRDDAQKFTAFAVNCTHLGCPVSWLAGPSLFMCPCHGGVYNRDGTVAAGPPPASLNTYQVRILNGKVQVKATGIPISTE